MRVPAVVFATLVLTSVASASQAPAQYIINARVFAANPADASSTEVLGMPTFRVAGGRTATMDLGDATKGIRVEVTPSDLGNGKVALKVVVQARRAGRVATSAFDVLTGADTSVATVALQDAAGAFIQDERGRTLFMTLQTPRTSEPTVTPDGRVTSAVQPGNGVSWPVVVSEAKPRYTDEARRERLQGVVELEIVVQADGSVGDVRVTKSLDRTYGLDDAAVAAARAWQFKPGLREGVPVATRVGLVLEFKLN